MIAERRATTIVDVALHARVSQATVSRVLNGKTTVDPAIAARVRQAVTELRYRPSATAQSLVRGRTSTVAMIVPDLENPLFQGILRGVSRSAARDGYRVLVADTAEDAAEERSASLEARRRCDALVLCAPRMPDREFAEVIAASHPVVVVNRAVPESAAASVGVDYASGIRELASHLLGIGHTHVVYLAGPPASTSNAQRLAGLREFRATHPEFRITELAVGSTLDDGYRAAEDALATGASAALAFNDMVALGLLSRLRELDVPVPDRLAVAGFDDVPTARFATPSLTTMSVPRQELGAQAWQRLKALLDGDPAEHAVLFRPRLVVRDSTGRRP
ncbi:LacI family DNA-binding transcriptional regulator [Lysobacter korlensis]|uniref:LacI family DNA-binding transcriptional regulator n=1 Tax=Lysobacter korlensis TaxID=553636 RepID=A0ABV6RTA0_9GAMM